MKSKTLGLRVAGTIFGIVAVIHILRLVTGIAVNIGDCLVPIWVNVLGAIACVILCGWLWSLSRNS